MSFCWVFKKAARDLQQTLRKIKSLHFASTPETSSSTGEDTKGQY
jgi:hypothetical protein